MSREYLKKLRNLRVKRETRNAVFIATIIAASSDNKTEGILGEWRALAYMFIRQWP